jgi:O-antigen ligase
MLLPGALTLFLGFRGGGFYVGTLSLAAAEMVLVLGLRFALAKRPLQGVSAPLIVAVAAMALLAGWTLLSSNWSDSVARAFAPYSRVLLCGLLLLFFGMLPFHVRRISWMLYGVAAAIVVICAAALIARLLPEMIFDPTLISESRLGYPLTYWNALGLISCVGTVFCAHLACSTRDHPIARVLGAAAVPMLVVALYYTLSRGGIWAAPAALVIYAIVGRPRALLSGLVATGPATAIALLAASPASSVADGYPFQMVSEGKHVALVIVGCMGGAALLRACLLPLDNWFESLRLPNRVREPVIVCSIIAGVALVLGAFAVTDAPHLVSTKYHEFTDRENTGPARGEARLLSARPEGRFELWDVALDAYRAEPLHGTGAGTYVVQWNKDRESGSHVVNAHSLYLETLSELGIVGLILLVVAIAMILGAFAYRARGPDRAMFAALLAAGLAWAVHAGVDWDWQMPAVTIWLFAFGGAALARSLRWKRRRPRNELKTTVIRVGGAIACLLLAVVPARVALSQARLNSAIEAMNNNDCQAARSYANDSLSAVSQRPTPYTVMAYCDLMVGHYGSATIALQRALQRDPDNWELHYSLAVARAGAGFDPRGAAQRAALLNPNEPIAASAPLRFRGQNRRALKAAAEDAPRLPPKVGDP